MTVGGRVANSHLWDMPAVTRLNFYFDEYSYQYSKQSRLIERRDIDKFLLDWDASKKYGSVFCSATRFKKTTTITRMPLSKKFNEQNNGCVLEVLVHFFVVENNNVSFNDQSFIDMFLIQFREVLTVINNLSNWLLSAAKFVRKRSKHSYQRFPRASPSGLLYSIPVE